MEWDVLNKKNIKISKYIRKIKLYKTEKKFNNNNISQSMFN